MNQELDNRHNILHNRMAQVFKVLDRHPKFSEDLQLYIGCHYHKKEVNIRQAEIPFDILANMDEFTILDNNGRIKVIKHRYGQPQRSPAATKEPTTKEKLDELFEILSKVSTSSQISIYWDCDDGVYSAFGSELTDDEAYNLVVLIGERELFKGGWVPMRAYGGDRYRQLSHMEDYSLIEALKTEFEDRKRIQ